MKFFPFFFAPSGETHIVKTFASNMLVIQMAADLVDKRKFKDLRKLVDDSSRVYKFVLKWGAKHLGPENQAELDKILKQHLKVDLDHKAIDARPNIKRLFSAASSDQRKALVWMSHKLAPDDLGTMDKLIEMDTASHRSKHASLHAHQ
jgi:hypothetical protein